VTSKVTPVASTVRVVTVGLPGVAGVTPPDGVEGAPEVLNVAVTAAAPPIVHEHVAAVPLHAPLQPANTEPEAAVAVRVTRVPVVRASVQSVPHVIPAGLLETVPEPEPFLATVSVTAELLDVEPVTERESVSFPVLNVTLPAKLPVVVGRNCTVTSRLEPPPSEKLLPEVMLNGAPTLTVTEMPVVLVFCTVKVRSTVPLTATLPKFVLPVGDTVKSAWAAPLTDPVHPLSLPALSTAVTRAKYMVPAESPVIRVETVSPLPGVAVGEGTAWKEPLGQAGADAPR
jgi:hypothetical protein